MAKNSNGEGSIYKWMKGGKPAGYKGAISYRDEDDNPKRYVAYGRTANKCATSWTKRANGSILARRSGTRNSQWANGSPTGGPRLWRFPTVRSRRRRCTRTSAVNTLSQPHSELSPWTS
jgi:hypothetical protein